MRSRSHAFRAAMGHFATGVTVVTGLDRAGGPVGLTANSVASVSLEPRMLLVCVSRTSSSLGSILDDGRFGVSILGAEGEGLARSFSRERPDSRFRGVPLLEAPSGLPLLADAIAWLDCRVWKSLDAGDHTILIGEVEEFGTGEETPPLVFFRGRYGSFAP